MIFRQTLATSNARTQTGFKGFYDLNLKNYLNISTDNVSNNNIFGILDSIFFQILKMYYLASSQKIMTVELHLRFSSRYFCLSLRRTTLFFYFHKSQFLFIFSSLQYSLIIADHLCWTLKDIKISILGYILDHKTPKYSNKLNLINRRTWARKEEKFKIEKLSAAFQWTLIDMKQICQNEEGEEAQILPLSLLKCFGSTLWMILFPLSWRDSRVFELAGNILNTSEKVKNWDCEVPEYEKLVSFILQSLYPSTWSESGSVICSVMSYSLPPPGL